MSMFEMLFYVKLMGNECCYKLIVFPLVPLMTCNFSCYLLLPSLLVYGLLFVHRNIFLTPSLTPTFLFGEMVLPFYVEPIFKMWHPHFITFYKKKIAS